MCPAIYHDDIQTQKIRPYSISSSFLATHSIRAMVIAGYNYLYFTSNFFYIDEGEILIENILFLVCYPYYYSLQIIMVSLIPLDRIDKTDRNYNWKLIITMHATYI